MAKSFLNMPGYPLGLRNNNPGNLRTGDNWQGMIGENAGFVQFKDISWGLRALAIDLNTKITNGFDTISLIIYRYAPPSENDTQSYINAVVITTGIPANQKLYPNGDTLKRLMRGIINVEIGGSFAALITGADIEEGISMMGTNFPVGEVGIGVAGGLLALALVLLATMPKVRKSRSY